MTKTMLESASLSPNPTLTISPLRRSVMKALAHAKSVGKPTALASSKRATFRAVARKRAN